MDLTAFGTLFVALLISFMLIYSTWDKMYRRRNLPPGPTPLPLIGNLLHVKKGELVKSLMQLAEKYGSVYTLYFGSRPVVILCGYKAVKEALIDQGEDFNGRGQMPTIDRVFQGHGVILSNGEPWKNLRRFTLLTLRNFGMGKRSIEERIQEEARFLIEALKKQKQVPIDPTNTLLQSISNVICSVVFGNRFEYENLEFLKLLRLFNEIFQKMSSTWGQLHDMIPEVMNHVPGPHQNIDKLMKKLLDFVSKRIEMNQKTLDPTSPRDFIDCFVIKMKQENQNPTSVFDTRNLVMSVLQLFFAGTETVSSTLRHGLLILVNHPEILGKVHEEIDRVIGQNRCPNIEDRKNMPYTDAVIHEIQRFSDVLPLGVPHKVLQDTKFNGYTLPKGTDVYPLLCTVLRDPTQFATPDKFNPGHFLDDKGHFVRHDAFVPFSTGKRICAGESLARMELFLFLTNILQNFTLKSQKNFTDADIMPKLTGFANALPPHRKLRPNPKPPTAQDRRSLRQTLGKTRHPKPSTEPGNQTPESDRRQPPSRKKHATPDQDETPQDGINQEHWTLASTEKEHAKTKSQGRKTLRPRTRNTRKNPPSRPSTASKPELTPTRNPPPRTWTTTKEGTAGFPTPTKEDRRQTPVTSPSAPEDSPPPSMPDHQTLPSVEPHRSRFPGLHQTLLEDHGSHAATNCAKGRYHNGPPLRLSTPMITSSPAEQGTPVTFIPEHVPHHATTWKKDSSLSAHIQHTELLTHRNGDSENAENITPNAEKNQDMRRRRRSEAQQDQNLKVSPTAPTISTSKAPGPKPPSPESPNSIKQSELGHPSQPQLIPAQPPCPQTVTVAPPLMQPVRAAEGTLSFRRHTQLTRPRPRLTRRGSRLPSRETGGHSHPRGRARELRSGRAGTSTRIRTRSSQKQEPPSSEICIQTPSIQESDAKQRPPRNPPESLYMARITIRGLEIFFTKGNMDITDLGTLVLTVLVFCMVIYSTWDKMYRRRNLPPGPTPLPMIGNLLQIKRGEMAKSLVKVGKQYGPVYTLYFGSRPVVIISGYQAVKEALVDQGEEFSGRGRMVSVDKIFDGFGVVFSNGERWKQLRRFSLTTLRNFGMGKRSIEERIQEEAQCLQQELRNYKQAPIDPQNILVQAVSNVICSVVFGNRFEYEDMKFLKLLNLFNKTFQLLSSTWGQLQELIPSIMDYIPGPHHKINSIMEELLVFVSERVKKNQETIDPASPRDYIDCFIIKMQQENKNPASEFHMKNLLLTVLNLFFAGTETVSSTLKHGFLILIKYPEIQEKLHKEIDTVIGHNRSPNIEDRSKMPYMDAVIHEIQRFCDIIPLNVPHSVIKDTTFRGYSIPKGTDVYPLLCSVLQDPSQFSTPDKFNPGHFLDDSGCFKKSDAFLPFSTGKRICLGEGLARMELFLFLTTILQNFTLRSNTQFTESDIMPKMTGFVNVPIPYTMSFVPR
ncbi:uncharacterized protein WCC33_015083 [Rhinophrynus dorsalis]